MGMGGKGSSESKSSTKNIQTTDNSQMGADRGGIAIDGGLSKSAINITSADADVLKEGFDFGESALGFAGDSSQQAYNFARDLSKALASGTSQERRDNADLSKHLAETAIKNVAQSMKDPDAQTLETVTKVVVAGGVLLGAVYIIKTK